MLFTPRKKISLKLCEIKRVFVISVAKERVGRERERERQKEREEKGGGGGGAFQTRINPFVFVFCSIPQNVSHLSL